MIQYANRLDPGSSKHPANPGGVVNPQLQSLRTLLKLQILPEEGRGLWKPPDSSSQRQRSKLIGCRRLAQPGRFVNTNLHRARDISAIDVVGPENPQFFQDGS